MRAATTPGSRPGYSRRTPIGALVLLALAPLGALPAAAAACEPDGVQASGAIHRICMPERWNGDLVLFAHGYVGFDQPVAIPEDQLALPDGTSLPDLVTRLGFAFATTSYSGNGLAVVQGMADLVDLIDVFRATHAAPRRVYLTGVSEGGLITALLTERRPDLFAGGLATCGPVGDFPRQVNHFGDFRVIFDAYFPGVIPGSPVQVPPDVIENFFTVHTDAILAEIRADPDRTREMLAVLRAPADPAIPVEVEDTIMQLAWYNVFATNDARSRLGGQPFDNRRRFYIGSEADFLLNLRVERFTADAAALESMRSIYQTMGRLSIPLVTMHTLGDPVIPYWHERAYALKTLLAGSGPRHLNIPINRYGHCAFTAPEALAAFALLVLMAGGDVGRAAEAILADDPGAAAAYRTMVGTHAAAAARAR